MSRQRIIVDTDPGQDDAVAVLLALASAEEIEVVGVVAVAGNVPLDKTLENALRIVELAGRTDVPVYGGASRPLMRELTTEERVHGGDGLAGHALPEPSITAAPQHGVDYLVDALTTNASGTITLCTLGPLTNVAMALVKAPEVAGRIRQIVMMGGAYFEVGNTTPTAEFNIHADPHAADIVMRSGVPITMVPLDLTYRVLATPGRIEAIAALGNRAGKAVAGWLTAANNRDLSKFGSVAAPLHDPCVIAWLLRPDLFKGKSINVSI